MNWTIQITAKMITMVIAARAGRLWSGRSLSFITPPLRFHLNRPPQCPEGITDNDQVLNSGYVATFTAALPSLLSIPFVLMVMLAACTPAGISQTNTSW